MRRLIGSIGFAWLLAFVALGILATRTFHPHHRLAAALIYAVSWVFFLLAFRNKRRWLRTHAEAARGLVKGYGWYVAFVLFVLCFNYRYSIIEAKRPGVILTSLEDSANADSLAVLRPRLSKSDRFRAVIAAFSYLGRPYDYNFDFRTDSELVCWEVIYKAFEGVEGFTLTPEELNGRPMLAPNRIGQKFDDELGAAEQELDLVLFLDGNEVEETAVERGEDAFRSSWQRPKWHILKLCNGLLAEQLQGFAARHAGFDA